MTDEPGPRKPDRPPLPRDGFRGSRSAVASAVAAPLVVTPDYGDEQPRPNLAGTEALTTVSADGRAPAVGRNQKTKAAAPRNPFDAYGERSSSRPYALRLPDAIDLVLRQMAAEERTHPLRIVDRILHDHLKKIGRLPPIGT